MTDSPHPKTPDRLSPTKEALLIVLIGGLLTITAAFFVAEVLLVL